MSRTVSRLGLAGVTFATFVMSSGNAVSQTTEIERGKYLVTLGGCNDCHTPGYFFGKPDTTRYLGGSEVGFEIPGLGVFLWPQSHAGPRYWPRPMVDGRNRDCDHQGPATGRPRACADHALACVRKPHAAGRARDHKFSQELAAGKEQGSWAIWSEREANLIRDEDHSG